MKQSGIEYERVRVRMRERHTEEGDRNATPWATTGHEERERTRPAVCECGKEMNTTDG